MGKDKDQKFEAPGNAFSRMNYLYQASQLVTQTNAPTTSPLSSYYNKLLKEISKKVVEKLHPDLKRTICCSCNYPLTCGSDQINVKIKHHRKRKKKNKKDFDVEKNKEKKLKFSSDSVKEYKSRIDKRNKRPNRILWSCSKCSYTRRFVQKPSYKIWIHRCQDKS